MNRFFARTIASSGDGNDSAASFESVVAERLAEIARLHLGIAGGSIPSWEETS